MTIEKPPPRAKCRRTKCLHSPRSCPRSSSGGRRSRCRPSRSGLSSASRPRPWGTKTSDAARPPPRPPLCSSSRSTRTWISAGGGCSSATSRRSRRPPRGRWRAALSRDSPLGSLGRRVWRRTSSGAGEAWTICNETNKKSLYFPQRHCLEEEDSLYPNFPEFHSSSSEVMPDALRNVISTENEPFLAILCHFYDLQSAFDSWK